MKSISTKCITLCLVMIIVNAIEFTSSAETTTSTTIESKPQVKAFDRPAIYGDQIVLYSTSNQAVTTIPLQGKQINVITDWSERYLLYKQLTEKGLPNGLLKI